MEVHFSQRLILGEWSWSLHRATEKDATIPVKKSKKIKKNSVYKNLLSLTVHSTSKCHKKVKKTNSWTVYSAEEFWSFPLLLAEEVLLAGFFKYSSVVLVLCLKFITAQQFG